MGRRDEETVSAPSAPYSRDVGRLGGREIRREDKAIPAAAELRNAEAARGMLGEEEFAFLRADFHACRPSLPFTTISLSLILRISFPFLLAPLFIFFFFYATDKSLTLFSREDVRPIIFSLSLS